MSNDRDQEFVQKALPETAAALVPGIRNAAVIWLRRSLADIDERFHLVDMPGYGYAKVSKSEKERWNKIFDQYIADTKIHRKDAPRFIDKMPNNFPTVGLIHLILPNAKIIDARRDPLACCFSGFKQLFADAYLYSYDLEELARYNVRYHHLMATWRERFPQRFIDVEIEADDHRIVLEGDEAALQPQKGRPHGLQVQVGSFLLHHESKQVVYLHGHSHVLETSAGPALAGQPREM